MSRWLPHITVAAVIEENQRFLMVEEIFEGYSVFNQPAGHIDKDESLLEAVSREVLIESGWHFFPEFLIGIYQYVDLYNHETFLRFSFAGKHHDYEKERQLEKQIKAVRWLTKDELIQKGKFKTSIVLRSINDYLNGIRYPIEIINSM